MNQAVIDKFNIRNLGFIELLFAFFLILSGYKYGALRFDMLVLLIMDFISIKRQHKPFLYRPLFLMFLFLIFHEILLFGYVKNLPSSHLNLIIGLIIYVFSIMIIVPAIDYKKLVSSLYFVALISILGIAYHFVMIQSGASVTPIKLPFFPEMISDSRLYEEGLRPKGFYFEPAAFITFIIIPLFVSLYERRYLWTTLIVFSMFLSTSTTGIAISLVIVATYVVTQKVKTRYKFAIALMSLLMVYMLLTGDIFKAGLEKIETTDVETNIRLHNGPELINNMPFKHIVFGFPQSHIYDYYVHTPYLKGANLFVRGEYVFVPTFWQVLAKEGLIGMFLFLSLYIKIAYWHREILPLLAGLGVMLFTTGTFFSSAFTYQFIFILVFCIYSSKRKLRIAT